METLQQDGRIVNSGPGRPRKRTQKKEAQIISYLFQSALVDGGLPSDEALGQRFGLGGRTVRQIRLDHGINRWDVRRWRKSGQTIDPNGQDGAFCYTPFAGLWLLVPLLLKAAWARAVSALKWPFRTTITGWQFTLTLVMWSVLNFQRFWHLDDFRNRADLGLALFTGRRRLLADSTLWKLVHSLERKVERSFYDTTAAANIDPEDPDSAAVISFDDHVVPSFTKLEPAPLPKTRVPTRGRSYPANRMYYHFDLKKGRILGLEVKHKRLSQILPELIQEVRRLKRLAGHPDPDRLRIIFDRGGYKGSLFKKLMEDPNLIFLTMACCYARSVRQWEAIPEKKFQPYQPPGEGNPNLKIADTTTKIRDCAYPLRSIVIRDGTPDTKQRWRVLFTNDQESEPEVLDREYRSRQGHENIYSELKYGLAGDNLPKAYHLLREDNAQGEKRKTFGTYLNEQTTKDIHLVGWIRGLGLNLVHDFGAALGDPYARMKVKTLVRKFIARPGKLKFSDGVLRVQLEPFDEISALQPWLDEINGQGLRIPWLGDRLLRIEIAQRPSGMIPGRVPLSSRIFANSLPL
ncbi:MAG: hypothetical protein U9M97_00975 [Candidatus Hadarchaeota archaeon]|nr:hypothetical protein [Candidatus Hadarchaeota archaeon]